MKKESVIEYQIMFSMTSGLEDYITENEYEYKEMFQDLIDNGDLQYVEQCIKKEYIWNDELEDWDEEDVEVLYSVENYDDYRDTQRVSSLEEDRKISNDEMTYFERIVNQANNDFKIISYEYEINDKGTKTYYGKLKIENQFLLRITKTDSVSLKIFEKGYNAIPKIKELLSATTKYKANNIKSVLQMYCILDNNPMGGSIPIGFPNDYDIIYMLRYQLEPEYKKLIDAEVEIERNGESDNIEKRKKSDEWWESGNGERVVNFVEQSSRYAVLKLLGNDYGTQQFYDTSTTKAIAVALLDCLGYEKLDRVITEFEQKQNRKK